METTLDQLGISPPEKQVKPMNIEDVARTARDTQRVMRPMEPVQQVEQLAILPQENKNNNGFFFAEDQKELTILFAVIAVSFSNVVQDKLSTIKIMETPIVRLVATSSIATIAFAVSRKYIF